MTAATPGQAHDVPESVLRDRHVGSEFSRWTAAQGYPGDTGDRPEYAIGDMAKAFAAGFASAEETATGLRDRAAQDAQPAPDLEAAFASGMRVRTAPCTADAHDREHFQVRTNGHWLCGHLLASMLAAQGIVAGAEPKPAPELGGDL